TQAELVLQPLRLAFESKNIKLVELALDCLHSFKNSSASSSPAVKARNVWPGGYSTKREEVTDGEEVGIEAAKNMKKNSPVKVPESSLTNSRGSLTKKRGVGRPAKGRQRGGRGSRQGSPKKRRKRSRS
ncbi:hypothetical protein ACMD2_05242, partial [Ananas comosus]